MKVECPNCQRKYSILDEIPPPGEEIPFSCPACKTAIEGHLPSDSEQDRPSSESASPDKGRPSNEALKKEILQTLSALPPMPQILSKAREVMANPKSGFKELAGVLETDQAIAARVLKLANSAYYGLSGKVSSIQHASVVLGQNTLGDLINMAGSLNVLGKTLKGYGLASGDLWLHSIAVAFGSRLIAEKKKPDLVNDAFSAGLIHDAGKLILDPYIFERRDLFRNFIADGQKTFLSAEKEILGFDHSEIAAEVCKNWNIPESLTKAIRFHHYPALSKGDELAYIVHIADSIALMTGIGGGMDGMLYKMDENAIKLLRFDEIDLTNVMQDIAEHVDKMARDMVEP